VKEDDGVSLLGEVLCGVPQKFKRGGLMMGFESTIRMPVRDIDRLRATLAENSIEVVDASSVMRNLRLIKSGFEVARIRHACNIASSAFAALPASLDLLYQRKQVTNPEQPFVTEREMREEMRRLMFYFGADDTPYVMCQSGVNGYDNIILEPTDKVLQPGTVVVIDTGMCFEGYWCDFDRNFVVGGDHLLSEATKRAQDLVWQATEDGFQICEEHGTSSDVFRVMSRKMGQDPATNSTGRMGHGLGLHITESFSNNATDEEPLTPGVCMTLEPGMLVDPEGELMIVHEENLVITEDGAEWLSNRAPRRIPSILVAQAEALAPNLKSRL